MTMWAAPSAPPSLACRPGRLTAHCLDGRQLAAGDQLRVIYDNLSKDPNSLANLDQDLPNYAQHQVPRLRLTT